MGVVDLVAAAASWRSPPQAVWLAVWLATALLAAAVGVAAMARKLEEAGLIACSKSFVERMPRTEYRLTAAGRKRLEQYLRHLEAVIRHARGA